ncbi:MULTISPECIES: RadC family protein [Acinetobacter]|uniref:JAB domain-containing protein n=1 Tax=Acinetobacter wuhouensis TaxID=1879050 RepID=A0A3G2T7X9_9GAMM|nr:MULTISPECIES: DNA repair protein RadC [Acinetobacter]AYO55637.1 JAB domain-containing protein [Acinetobacter wuhouensis]RZG46288.1 JAB domain-containing protein [Acinetobacter wuhouensis]RZG71641.1 JAB domain-containing protein [Acinetobacter wuhouensis]RZG80478.1 JAB domain-containing protein [Acinetobacter sp. WCHAc060033]
MNNSTTSLPHQSIKQWPEQERPRERLLLQGAHSLSDAELLAIFLRSGSKQHSAVELSRLLIQHFGNLNAVFDSSLEDLRQFHGIGDTKYSQLMAVKELGRRYLKHQLDQGLDLSRSDLIRDYLRYELLGEAQEVFAVLCLDSQLRKISFKKLFFGSINYCNISINQLLRYAIQKHATFIVIAHNHPKGFAKPSREDYDLTQQILTACQLLEIELLDHIIIASEQSYSFAEHALIKSKTFPANTVDKCP